MSEKTEILDLKDGCLFYLEKQLALKDKNNPISLYSICQLDTEVNKLFSDAFLNKPGKVLSCKNDAKYGAG